jgi:TrmH family RNA methyltransferase
MPAPQTLIVQSRQNARVRSLRAALARPPGLGSGELVGIEGIHLLEEALASGVEVETVFVRVGSEAALEGLPTVSAQVVLVTEEVLRGAVSTEAPQGVAALVRPPRFELNDLFSPAAALVVVIAALQDPGNLGTIVRSAEAFGATGMIVLPGTVHLWNAKCLRASAGSVFRLPVQQLTAAECIDALRERGVRSLATVVTGGCSADAGDLTAQSALWIGNEGAGLAAELVAMCDERVTIPCPGAVQSLNAAIAASVLLYEASRQRQRKP